jgi:hypothetical protein
MEGTRNGFIYGLLIAPFVVLLCGTATAQDMPPILVPLAPAPVVAPNPPPAPVSPTAEAVLPPAPIAAPVKPVEKPQIAAVPHAPAVHHHVRVASVKKRLAAPRHIVHVEHRVAARAPEPALPPGMPVPPPGYYGPGPYRHLVYAGPPPPGFYGGWGYRGPYPDYP